MILLVWVLKINAQTNNSFSNHFEEIYSFNKDKSLRISKTSNYLLDYSISDFKGNDFIKVAYNLNFDSFYLLNHKNEQIKNANFNIISEPLRKTNLLTIDTNKILYLSLNDANDEILYSFISMENNELKINKKDKNLSIKLPSSTYNSWVNVTRNKEGNIVLLIRTVDDILLSYIIEYNKVPILVNSINLNIYEKRIDSLDFNPILKKIKSPPLYGFNISNSGNLITIGFISKYEIKRTKKVYAVYVSNSLFEFNKENGTIQFLHNIDSSFSHLLSPTLNNNITFLTNLFSPNDSFLYLLMREDNYYSNIKEKIHLIQYDIFNQRKNIIKTEIVIENNDITLQGCAFLLNSFGEIVYNLCDKTLNQFFFNKIPFSNLNYPDCQNFVNPYNIFKDLIFPFEFRHLYDYLRTDHTITYDCKATVQIKNNSQPWIGFTDYKWHILNDKGQEEYYTTKEPPTLTYTKNGDYYIKLFGYSPRGKGYGEWYIDTIKVRIPPKPVASFRAKDSVVCRYSPLAFTNLSQSQQSTTEEYLWSFGDGNTSNLKNPTHIYNQVGVYTVTLHYKNGYCDSSLTKNQYIRVVDAPKPGFAINTTQGCSPLPILITDTNTRHVTSKDYFISDGSGWVKIPNGSFTLNHTLQKPGRYKVKQRLTGYTGCITQTDSVWVHVSKGITLQDTQHISNSTIVSQHAQLTWQPTDGAVKYHIYKNATFYQSSPQTQWTDPQPHQAQHIYTIKAVDSCGTESSWGREGMPVFLKIVKEPFNQAAVVHFTPYEKWISQEKTYFIQKQINGAWVNINQSNNNEIYRDAQLTENVHLQTCYRIETQEINGQNNVSHSNEVCVVHEPVIFIPTSFTPNGDTYNDVFGVVSIGISVYEMKIYNRWGQLVFEGNTNETWSGAECSEGVYQVNIQYTTITGEKGITSSTVTLLK